MVDGAVHGRRVERLQERARSVVDGLTGDRRVVGVHHAVDEAHQHPPGHQRRLGGHHRLEQREVRALGGRGRGVVPGDGVVGQPAQQVHVVGGARVLEAAHPQVAARDPCQHGPRQHGLAVHRGAGRDDGQRPGGGDPERVHRLAHDVLAQHRAHRGQTVAAAGERGPAGALEMQVARPAVGVRELAEQQGPAVAEAGRVVAELVARVGLRDRGSALGDVVADQQPQAVRGAQPFGGQAQVRGQRLVEHEQARVGCLVGPPRQRQLGDRLGEVVGQRDDGCRCGAHVLHGTGCAPVLPRARTGGGACRACPPSGQRSAAAACGPRACRPSPCGCRPPAWPARARGRGCC